MRALLAAGFTVLACAPAAAGELIFANGSRLAGELSNEALMVSTGAGLVEVAPEEVTSLSRDEVHLRDGRVIRGTLVGGRVKAKTALGEIAVKVEELEAYRAAARSGGAGVGSSQAAPPAPAGAPGPGAPAEVGPVTAGGAISGGLPTVAAYQEGAVARPGGPGAGQGGVQPAVLTREAPPTPAPLLEVVGESGLYRDALFSSSQVGRVAAGQQVRYVDSIDRRLRILNLLVFDGGYWIKVRLADGTEGWVPARNVREVR
jgi:hypothetical protein